MTTLGYLAKAKADLCKNPSKAQVNRPTLLRSLFTLGLLCKQFDFDSDVKPKNEVSSEQDCVMTNAEAVCNIKLTIIIITDVLSLVFKQGSTKDRVFAVYIYFTKHSDEEVCQKAITGLGRWF